MCPMRYDPVRHHRQPVRWREHDSAAGGTYFVTLVTVERACLFGEIRDGEMRLNALGRSSIGAGNVPVRFAPRSRSMCSRLCRTICTG